MSLADSQVRAIQATEKRQTVALGDSLFLVVEPSAKGGGKSFMGRTRFPPRSPKNGGKQVDVRIGVYGKGVGKWTLKAARDEWDRIRAWSREHGRDPRDLKREAKAALLPQSSGPTLEQACAAYLESTTIKTKEEYRRILWNEALPRLGADLPVRHFSWDFKQQGGKTGREVVMDFYRSVESRAPVQGGKVLMVLRQVFNHAIDSGWMDRDQNPALLNKGTKRKHKATPHPTLSWEQLPRFFQELEANQVRGSVVTVAAVKALFMTFLRVGALTPMRWDELDPKEDLWVVPGSRMKNGLDHLVPLTTPLKELFETLRKFNGNEEYVFCSPRRSGVHMSPYSINQHFVRMGYKGVLRAHGVRSIPLTAGQEVLGFSAEVIQRQMAHIIGDKVRQAYDRSKMMNERRNFMVAWCDALLQQGLIV
jgi:integrase